MSKRQAQSGRKRVTTKCRKCDSESSRETTQSPSNVNNSINHVQVKKEVEPVESPTELDQSSSSHPQTDITSSTPGAGPPEGPAPKSGSPDSRNSTESDSRNSTESDVSTVTFELEIDSEKREQVKSMLENLERYGVVAKGATQNTLIVFDTVEKHGVRARVFNQPVRVLTSNTPTVTFELEMDSEKKRIDSKKRELIKSMVEYLERYGIVARGATQNTLIVFDTIEEHGILARVFKHKAIMIATSSPLPRRDKPIPRNQRPQASGSSTPSGTDGSTSLTPGNPSQTNTSTNDPTFKNPEVSPNSEDSTLKNTVSTSKTGEIVCDQNELKQDKTNGLASTPDGNTTSKYSHDDA